MNPYLQQINSNHFDYSKTGNRMDADISDLPRGTDPARGFTIISEKTGFALPVELFRVHIDRDHDITHWELIPTRNAQPAAPGLRVIIWND